MSRGSSRDRDSMMREMEAAAAGGGGGGAGAVTGDKSARSVFVGNIPYEATEEKLKDIFSEVSQGSFSTLLPPFENGNLFCPLSGQIVNSQC